VKGHPSSALPGFAGGLAHHWKRALKCSICKKTFALLDPKIESSSDHLLEFEIFLKYSYEI
jgi:hypothetical protein